MNLIVFGDSRSMAELPGGSVHLVVTSPPYFNAPFDYPGLFRDYGEFLDLIRSVARELRRVLAPGRVACFVTQDVRVEGRLYPIPADVTRIMVEEGFAYRDKIVWKKPEGYVRISRRSGVLVQHPYPMYFYPDNVFEEILVFQKGEFEYPRRGPELEKSRIDVGEFLREKWYLSVWEITNVLPVRGRVEEGVAAFPEEIPRRLIKLYSYVGETVLDPFLGSGTTCAAAAKLGRRCVGYEIDLELVEVVKKKLGIGQAKLVGDREQFKIVVREDAKRLRSSLQQKVRERAGQQAKK